MHVQHTILSVATTQGLVCTTHQRSVLYTLLLGCAHYTFMMVCYANHKRCAYRDIGFLIWCAVHTSVFTVRYDLQAWPLAGSNYKLTRTQFSREKPT